jgi:hypothetical protein
MLKLEFPDSNGGGEKQDEQYMEVPGTEKLLLMMSGR